MGYKNGDILVDLGNSFNRAGHAPSHHRCDNILIEAWGVSAQRVAQDLALSIETSGMLLGLDHTRAGLSDECDKFTKQRRPFAVKFTVAEQSLQLAA